MIVPIELRDIFKIRRAEKKEILKKNALREPNLTRFSRRTFAHRLARPKCLRQNYRYKQSKRIRRGSISPQHT